MSTITLIRHGETEWSASGRHTGRTDIPLTPEGEGQVRRLAPALRHCHFALVLCSPLQRARMTATLAGLRAVEVDDDLAEWDYGDYEGKTTAQIRTGLGRPWTVFADGVPGGETIAEVSDRADDVLRRVEPVLASGGDVALVGHGHMLRILAARWLGLEPAAGALLKLDAGTLSRLAYEHERSVIALWNARPLTGFGSD